mgnify:CR=1 FL=1
MKTTILKYITVTFAAGAMLLAGCNEFFESLLRQAQRIVLGHYTASGFISVLQHE